MILAFFRPQLDFNQAIGGQTAGITEFIGASRLPKPDYYTPGGMQQADDMFMQALQAISQAVNRNTGMVDPVLLHSYSQMLGIDLSGLVTGGAQAGDQYKQLATQAGGFRDASAGMGSAIQQQAFDPQNALHDFTRGGVIDTSRTADSSRGLAMSPYSSGNESTAARNFELDWQNRQLGREMAGSQGANQAYGASMAYGAAQPAATMAGAQAPIAGQTAAYGAPMDFSNQFLGAENNMMGQQAGVAGMALPYLQFGTNAASGKYNQSLYETMAKYGMLKEGMGDFFTGYGQGSSGTGDPGQAAGIASMIM